MSVGARPQRWRRARPASLCSAAKRVFPAPLSQFKTKFTPPLQRLHTPSKRMIGRGSAAKSSFARVRCSEESAARGGWDGRAGFVG